MSNFNFVPFLFPFFIPVLVKSTILYCKYPCSFLPAHTLSSFLSLFRTPISIISHPHHIYVHNYCHSEAICMNKWKKKKRLKYNTLNFNISLSTTPGKFTLLYVVTREREEEREGVNSNFEKKTFNSFPFTCTKTGIKPCLISNIMIIIFFRCSHLPRASFWGEKIQITFYWCSHQKYFRLWCLLTLLF